MGTYRKQWNVPGNIIQHQHWRYLLGKEQGQYYVKVNLPKIIRKICNKIENRLREDGKPMDDVVHPPICELGYATHLSRLQEHQHYPNSNYPISICKAEEELKTYNFAIRQHVISAIWRLNHYLESELFFSRLAQLLDDNGGGFSHHACWHE